MKRSEESFLESGLKIAPHLIEQTNYSSRRETKSFGALKLKRTSRAAISRAPRPTEVAILAQSLSTL